MNTGLRLKKIREKKEVSGKSLAEKVGVVPSQISKIENGVTNPSIDLLERICFALGITMADFFADDEVRNDNISPDLIETARKIKNLPHELRKTVETIVEVNEMKQSRNDDSEAAGK